MRRSWIGATAVFVMLASCTAGDGVASSSGTSPSEKTSEGESQLDGAIVFNVQRGGDWAVFTFDVVSGTERRVRDVGTEGAVLSPDGSRFMDVVPGEDGRITTSVFDTDGTNATVLSIPDPTLQLGYGAWSPDGTHLALDGWDDTDEARDGIYVRSASGGRRLVRVTDPGVRHDFPVAYSPDGSRLLFFRTVGSGKRDPAPMDLFVVKTDGSHLVRLNPPGTTSGLSVDPTIASASWSPDGKRVAFAASSGSFWDDQRALFVADADGHGVRRITPWSWTLNAQWSPNGRWIAFDRSIDSGPHDLVLIHPDGSDPVPITSSIDGMFSFAPVWSPAGERLLFIRSFGEFEEAYLWSVNVDGTGLVQVTDSPGEYRTYSWLP